MELLTSDKEYAEFGREFLDRFLAVGYGTYSKNDLQDMMLYIINRVSGRRPIDNSSNYDLAKLLKVSEPKVKTIRLNLALKFFTPEERKQILYRFFERIRDGKVIVEADDRTFQFVVENIVDRREIENRLKLAGVTLDYRNNREIVVIKKEHFFRLLVDVTQRSDDELLAAFSRRLKRSEFGTKVGEVFKQIGKYAVDVSKQVLREVIKDLLIPVK
jgi:hypothetical protein